jgi:tocopherol O-methyltransferase
VKSADAKREPAKQIEQFYCETADLLERLWGGPTHMIHFGYYPDAQGKDISHHESLLETVRQAALRLDVQPGQLILDAGCGVGGAAVWLANTRKLKVHGITNVQLHVDKATKYAKDSGAFGVDAATFLLADYTNTGFSSDTYDGVMAIESACYAPDKAAFLREMFRVLKPGARISVLDAFRTDRTNSSENERIMQSWLTGWGANDIDTVKEFSDKASTAGFVDIKFEDLQPHFKPSHQIGYRSARYLTPLLAVGNRIGLVSNVVYGFCRACRDAYIAAERGLCVQGIFSAQKPAR